MISREMILNHTNTVRFRMEYAMFTPNSCLIVRQIGLKVISLAAGIGIISIGTAFQLTVRLEYAIMLIEVFSQGVTYEETSSEKTKTSR